MPWHVNLVGGAIADRVRTAPPHTSLATQLSSLPLGLWIIQLSKSRHQSAEAILFRRRIKGLRAPEQSASSKSLYAGRTSLLILSRSPIILAVLGECITLLTTDRIGGEKIQMVEAQCTQEYLPESAVTMLSFESR